MYNCRVHVSQLRQREALKKLLKQSALTIVYYCVYRAAFAWFSVEPGWCKVPVQGVAKDEAEAVACFAQYFAQINSDIVNTEEGSVRSKYRSSKGASSSPPRSVPEAQVVSCYRSLVSSPLQVREELSLTFFVSHHIQVGNHPVWGKENSDFAARERRKLLLVLCQHEADRLETWAYPLR